MPVSTVNHIQCSRLKINVISIIASYRLDEEEMKAEYGTIIDLYSFAKERFKHRFVITEDHVIAALLDPAQKRLAIIDKHITVSKKSLLEAALKRFEIAQFSNSESSSIEVS